MPASSICDVGETEIHLPIRSETAAITEEQECRCAPIAYPRPWCVCPMATVPRGRCHALSCSLNAGPAVVSFTERIRASRARSNVLNQASVKAVLLRSGRPLRTTARCLKYPSHTRDAHVVASAGDDVSSSAVITDPTRSLRTARMPTATNQRRNIRRTDRHPPTRRSTRPESPRERSRPEHKTELTVRPSQTHEESP